MGMKGGVHGHEGGPSSFSLALGAPSQRRQPPRTPWADAWRGSGGADWIRSSTCTSCAPAASRCLVSTTSSADSTPTAPPEKDATMGSTALQPTAGAAQWSTGTLNPTFEVAANSRGCVRDYRQESLQS